jgi:hypothetical protein
MANTTLVTRVKKTNDGDYKASYTVHGQQDYIFIEAKDELDAFNIATTRVEEAYMTGRNFLICLSAVIISIIAAVTFGSYNSSVNRSEAFAACLKASRQFSVNDSGFYSCK